jgi:diaminopimelate epimerase
MKKAATRQGKPIPFQKLHGAGNDILIVEAKHLPKIGKPALLRRMAHRQLGIGCDQVVEVLSRKPLRVQIWNQDGSRAEMCANGSRVLLFLAAKEGWISRASSAIPLEISGKKYVALKTKGGYELCLGKPDVGEESLLRVGQSRIPYFPVSVGNPHAVILAGPRSWRMPKDYSLLRYGPAIECHSRFPQKTNVEIVRSWKQRGSVVEASVDVWERGAGATLSCGSGAVAVAAVLRKLSGAKMIKVRMTDYLLTIRFEGERAYLSGPSALVAKGLFFS